jgi:PAS domain S-box-containing protein
MSVQKLAGIVAGLRARLEELKEHDPKDIEGEYKKALDEIGWLLEELEATQGALGDRKDDLVRKDRELSVAYDALNSSASGIIITDLEGKIVYANPSFIHMFEYESKDEVLYRQAADLFTEEEIRSLYDVEESIDGGAGETEEFVVRRKDGSKMDVEVSSSVVSDRRGRPVGRMASFVDVTELLLVREERERLLTAVESAAEAMVVTDERGVILYANTAFEEVTGYPPGEVVGQDLDLLDTREHDPAFNKEVRRSLEERGVWRGRLVSRKKDGTPYQEDCIVSTVKDEGGQVINYVAVKRDVTEMLRLESLAEAVNVADNIGYVFTGIRHEIGNPVNAIRMTMTMLKARLDKAGDSGSGKYIQRCFEELSRVQYLLDSLKSFNLFENPSIRQVNLMDFLEKFTSLVLPDLEKKGVSLEVSVNPDASMCLADPRALQQVMLNVVTNAAEACEGGADSKVAVRVDKKSGEVHIRVEDDGVGMTAEQLDKLFRPFHTTKPEGTGLGLVIARRMLSKMDGRIEIESEKDQGTTTSIVLPSP